MSNRIIVINQKGGVGKTTTCVNLAYSLSEMKYKVLMVDFDSQCNLTSSISADNTRYNSYDFITGACKAKDAVQTTLFENLFIIPGSIELSGLEIELSNDERKANYLNDTLSSLDNYYDFILLDCPPSLGLLTINALKWASKILIPMQCEYLSMEGLSLLLNTLNTAKKNLKSSFSILGIVFTMYMKRSKLNQETIDDVTNYFPNLVFKTVIPRNIRLAEAPSFGLPVKAYEKGSIGAKAYDELAKEVISRV